MYNSEQKEDLICHQYNELSNKRTEFCIGPTTTVDYTPSSRLNYRLYTVYSIHQAEGSVYTVRLIIIIPLIVTNVLIIDS